MFGWILRIILIIIVVRAIYRLVYGIAQGLSGAATPDRGAVGLVRDPICGTYIVPSRALTAGTGSNMRFFCSERCREAWTRR